MIKIEQNKEEKFREFVLNGLVEHNREKCQWFKENPLDGEDKYENFLAFDNEKIIGGAIGYVLYGWYFLDLLWIEETYRGKNIGTLLMKNIEDYVQKNDLVGIRTETWDFQAKGFYEKMGYKVFATIEDCPPETTNYFFMKRIMKK